MWIGESVQKGTDACYGFYYNAGLNHKKQGEAAGSGGLTMSNLEFPEWQEPYLEALMETDQGKLVGRVDLAERTIFLRLKEIQSSSKRRAEEQAIEDALRALTFLRRETVEFKTLQGELLATSQLQVN
jgi:hypothetical protein